MTGRSIRVRLTAWYVGLLAVATLTLAVGSSWLIHRSVVDAADASLAARIEGVRQYIDHMAQAPSVTELQDELHEYADLTLGETLLEVRDASGTLVRPTLPDWEQLRLPGAERGDAARPTFANRASQGRPFRVAAVRPVIHGEVYDVIAALPMGPAEAALSQFRWLLAALVPVVLGLAAAGGYWISGRALSPVDRMTRAAQAITLHRLDHRLDVPPVDDELRRLAMTFNDMLARLQASVADMQRLTSEASHELRTPVTLVRATAEVALRRERSAGEYKQALAEVLEHAEHLSSLVGDLLTLARADAGVEAPEPARVDLGAVATVAARAMQAPMRLAGLELAIDVGDRPIDIDGHAESLHRLVTILLDNAVKYTPAGGSVRVSVSSASKSDAAGAAVLTVVDTGIGIDAADQPHVFERFYRGATARQHAADGSGLGLAIAQTTVSRHGGTITVSPATAAGGCRAEVRLPLARQTPPEAPVRPAG